MFTTGGYRLQSTEVCSAAGSVGWKHLRLDESSDFLYDGDLDFRNICNCSLWSGSMIATKAFLSDTGDIGLGRRQLVVVWLAAIIFVASPIVPAFGEGETDWSLRFKNEYPAKEKSLEDFYRDIKIVCKRTEYKNGVEEKSEVEYWATGGRYLRLETSKISNKRRTEDGYSRVLVYSPEESFLVFRQSDQEKYMVLKYARSGSPEILDPNNAGPTGRSAAEGKSSLRAVQLLPVDHS